MLCWRLCGRVPGSVAQNAPARPQGGPGGGISGMRGRGRTPGAWFRRRVRRVLRRCPDTLRAAARADAEEAVERGPPVAAPVPAEDELVQVALDVLASQPVMHPQGPALQVREDPVDPGQDLVRLAVADHPFLPRVVGQAAVPEPAVGDDPRAGRDRFRHEPVQRRGGVVFHGLQPDAARLPAFRELDRPGGSCRRRCGPGLTRPSPLPHRFRRGRARTPRQPPRSPAAGSGPGRPWHGAACAAEAVL